MCNICIYCSLRPINYTKNVVLLKRKVPKTVLETMKTFSFLYLGKHIGVAMCCLDWSIKFNTMCRLAQMSCRWAVTLAQTDGLTKVFVGLCSKKQKRSVMLFFHPMRVFFFFGKYTPCKLCRLNCTMLLFPLKSFWHQCFLLMDKIIICF